MLPTPPRTRDAPATGGASEVIEELSTSMTDEPARAVFRDNTDELYGLSLPDSAADA